MSAREAVLLVARREVVARVQQRSYRIGLGIALLITVLAVAAPALFRGDGGPTRWDVAVAVTASGTADDPLGSGTLDGALDAAAGSQGGRVRIHRTDATQARAGIRDGRYDAALLPGPTVLAKHANDQAASVVQQGCQLARTTARLQAEGLTPAQVATALRVAAPPVHATESAAGSQRQTIAIVTVVLLFSQLITFCTWVAMGVVEEKSSRVVELLLTSVRPVQLLAGKLLGVGVLAAGQVLALGVAATVSATAARTVTVPAAAITTVLISFAAFLLGYAFFAAVSAALASTVSRQEEVSGVLAPVTVTLTACYGVAFSVATSGGDATYARVLSVVPPISAIAMPARIARGDAGVVDVVLAIVALLVTSAAMLALAGRVYRASILHTGSRLRLRQAWRAEQVATPR